MQTCLHLWVVLVAKSMSNMNMFTPLGIFSGQKHVKVKHIQFCGCFQCPKCDKVELIEVQLVQIVGVNSSLQQSNAEDQS